MSWVIRAGVCKLPSCGPLAGLCKVTPGGTNVTKMQVAFITGRALRVTERKRPAPFPYTEKNYNLFTSFFDKTTHRFDENSKIVVVEGPIASGKTEFAKDLAKELDMLYVPAPTMDDVFINEYGYDLRQLDSILPESVQSFDVEKFCKNPFHPSVATYQIRMYMLRYSQYIDALAHLLSTGEGVVLERSPYSDFVFVEAMHRSGYISKGAKSVYDDIKANTITELLKPHLVIYLDVPAASVMDKIQKRCIPYEVKSKAFTQKYLCDIENIYKQQYLKDISTHAHLLIYDWTKGGDVEVVVEDIERINFDDDFDVHDTKMKDWRFEKEWEWTEVRILYCRDKASLMMNFNVPRYDVPELLCDGMESKAWHQAWEDAPGNKYRKGYNADMGDTGIWKKTWLELRNTK